MPCHEQEYENFTKYARKSHSFQSVLKMKKGLTSDEIKQCYVCHTTGYGKSGGFVSLEQTPELKDAGCEVCHGPGEQHIESQDPADLGGKVTIEVCQTCHTAERVSAFRYKPMVHGGAH
jgi:DnaJ-class molecular chaperone